LRESSARDWRPITTDVYGTTHKVTGLKPKQDYQFRLRGVTDQGQTDYVYSVNITEKLSISFKNIVESGIKHHYVTKFVSDLRQVGSILRVLRFPPPIKLTATI
jgi:hypothetical protein